MIQKIRGKNHIRLVAEKRHLDFEAVFNNVRGYYKLHPLAGDFGCSGGAYEHFWAIWETEKELVKADGIFVQKEHERWYIFFRPRRGDAIHTELDESHVHSHILGDHL